MLTDLPSMEVTLLTLWKLTIITAALIFLFLVTMKALRFVRRSFKRLFKTRSKRRFNLKPSEAGFSHTAHLREEDAPIFNNAS